jgi:broad specificity phosphatase PhoE
MTPVYLIRHARPASTWGGADADPGLDETGRRQAEALVPWFTALPAELRPRRVISSPLARCRETAAPTAAALGVEVEVVEAVGEIPTPGFLSAAERPEWLRRAFEGLWSDIRGDIDYEAWRQSMVDFLAGAAGAAVFSHFVATNAVVSKLAGHDRVIDFRPDHASVTELEVADGRLVLVRRGREVATDVL